MRWASPVIYMRRTLTEDCELSGVKMAAGDKVDVVVLLGQPRRGQVRRPVDLRRRAAHPNPHVGFGGGGAHFCLGANLARREISVAFEELHRQMPDIAGDGRAGAAAVAVHPRHQAAAGVLDTTELSSSRVGPSGTGGRHPAA